MQLKSAYPIRAGRHAAAHPLDNGLCMDPLLAAAFTARQNARAPFSGFLVGAAVECDDGRIFGGCNIESSSYGLTICAERTAVFAAVAGGARRFRRVAIATAAARLTPPCGACRQVLWDLCGDIPILLGNAAGDTLTFQLRDLFPEPFDAQSLA
jgi:cytidine deaminase